MKKTFRLLMLALLSTFALASCEDVPMPYPNPDVNGGGDEPTEEILPEGDGTFENPYNVAAVVELCNNLGSDAESAQAVYVKGKVASNTTTEATISQYGNMTFTMIDEGNTKTTFTAFQVYGPEKKKFTSVDQIKEGDEVIVCGKVVNYKGNTPETVGKGQSYVVSINGQGEQPAEPTETIDITCAKAVELCAALEDGATSAETYTVTGYITDVYANVSKGQQSFWMADTKDGGKVLQAYWANLPEGVAAFTKGSKVKITGQLLKYVKDGNVTTEIKNADVVILEDGNGGTTDQPGTDQPATSDEISCAKAAELAMALQDKAESSESYTVVGYITETDGKISRDQQIFWMADTKDGGKVFEAYWANIPDPTKALTVGTKVKMTGKLMRYGSTPEMKNGNVVVLEMGEGGNTETPGGNDNQPSTGETVSELVNGSFEDWTSDSQPTGWKSASTASNATLSKSTDAHGGQYAVSVAGVSSSNKRLATQEITLEAGTYKFAFYAKATTGDKCQTRAGYVPVEGNSVGSYVYGDYVTINNSEWTLVEYSFTLQAKTTLCLVVMNPKNSSYSVTQNILIDDASLTK